MSEEVLQKRLARAKQRVAILEGMIEDSTRALFLSNEELKGNLSYLRKLQAMIPAAVVVVRKDGSLREMNRSAHELLGVDPVDDIRLQLPDFWPDVPSSLADVALLEAEWLANGEPLPVLISSATLDEDETKGDVVIVASDLRDRKRMEVELRHAQKLESIGQLAAGVAHEINTPMQFVGDNVAFLRESFDDLMRLLERAMEVAAESPRGGEVAELAEELDLDFLQGRLPKSFSRTMDGIERVTSIVGAMKAFSHPGTGKAPADLNEALQTTLAVATNEYRYVADVETDFGDLPMVHCRVGDLNQVFLNLIVNAAHAIQERYANAAEQGAANSQGERGTIRISTRVDGTSAEIRIEDDGGGIPEAIQARVFDPFFTTKSVGKGTGQGLSLAHTVIAERHRGTIHFESTPGEGTTFVIRIPIAAAAPEQAA